MNIESKPQYAGPYGQLSPTGGGDIIPLVKDRILVGRRAESDIQLKFANVSGQHCRLTLEQGYWFIRDLNSRNGIKVDGHPVIRKRLDPNCKVSIARHHFTIEYEPQLLGAYGPPPADDDYLDDLLKSSLMDRAGMSRRDPKSPYSNRNPSE
ncbi:FHA domain protein [Novipirellula aureliae]|uniref:FHA domain protein n=1 Tax=Novipirellula aureliae TaxID=2527966 RepID=A0A5C6DN69_9BACT|nr:FHA domain-containing protein [Novipirellula aureliae]TWU37614.1 FHA domain protein [Novipirellula aureliae]